MRSIYSQIVMLVSAVVAFAPILAVDYLLDNYVRLRETTQIQRAADALTEQIQVYANDGVGSLRRILAASPSLCTPTFIANVHKQMESSLHVRQVLVENADGVQYCDAFGRQVTYSQLSESLPIPGHTETVSVVRLGTLEEPVLRITQAFGTSRKVSAFVPVLANGNSTLLSGTSPGTAVRLSLTSGTQIAAVGDTAAFDRIPDETTYVSAQAIAGELPIRVEAVVPFAVVRANYADLDVSFTLVAALMSGSFLILMLQYVRKSRLPAFDLERAIQAGEIKPYYQPVINLKTGKLAGCEVLARWQKKNGQLVPPGTFIDYAEVTGLAIPMTLSLMEQVVDDLSDLCREMPDIKISINLFEGHFRDSNIVEDVEAIFGGSSIAFRQLVFEITERRPLDNATASTVINGLHALGARLAMDDVGTGHSNLAYMQTLGVDVIKIDRVFVDMVKPETTLVPVLDGLIAMARDLGTEIVAEGVETEAQALYLRARGVVMAQGFLFAPALKVGQFKDLARALNLKAPKAIEAPAEVVEEAQAEPDAPALPAISAA